MPSFGFDTTRLSLWKWCRLRGAGHGEVPLSKTSRIVATDLSLHPLAETLSEEIQLANQLKLPTTDGEAKPEDIVLKTNPQLRADADMPLMGLRDANETVCYFSVRSLHLHFHDESGCYFPLKKYPQAGSHNAAGKATIATSATLPPKCDMHYTIDGS